MSMQGAITDTMKDNEMTLLTVTPKDGGSPPSPTAPVITWTATPTGKVSLEVSADTLKCQVHGIVGQIGAVAVLANDIVDSFTQTCNLTIQSSATASLNMVAGAPVPNVAAPTI